MFAGILLPMFGELKMGYSL